MDDVAEVMKRGAPLAHVVNADVVLAQQILSFLVGHEFPLRLVAERTGNRASR